VQQELQGKDSFLDRHLGISQRSLESLDFVDHAIVRRSLAGESFDARISEAGRLHVRLLEIDIDEMPLPGGVARLGTAFAEGVCPGRAARDIAIPQIVSVLLEQRAHLGERIWTFLLEDRFRNQRHDLVAVVAPAETGRATERQQSRCDHDAQDLMLSNKSHGQPLSFACAVFNCEIRAGCSR
jgi:hypothetical protein